MDARQGMAAPRRGRLGFEDTLNFTNSLCLAYVLCSAVLRGWIRRGIYGFDDAVIAIGTLVTTGHFVANHIALEHGAGKPWDFIELAGNVTAYNETSVASVITFTLSLYLSKACVVAFLLRLTKKHGDTGLYKICLGCLAILGIACTLLVTAGWPQTLSAYWASSSNGTACSIQSTRWLIWTILDFLTEIVLFVLPLQLLWSLQMPRKNKLIVLVVFYLRLPIIGISVGRLLYTQRLCAARGDLGLDSALVLIWFAVESSYSLLASQFLALRTFTLGFNSGFGFGFTLKAGPESYSLQRTGKRGSNAGTRKGDADKTNIALDQIWHTLPPNGNVDASSKGRKSLNITRDTDISIQYQDITDESPILRKQ